MLNDDGEEIYCELGQRLCHLVGMDDDLLNILLDMAEMVNKLDEESRDVR